jgi:hypothetical protein
MTKKPITTVGQKLNKADNNFIVSMFDNGYMVEVGGKNSYDNWATAKIMCSTLNELLDIVTEITEMERDD